MMKKILNKPADYVDEMLAGLCLAHPEYYTQPEPRVITRAGGATEGKVGSLPAVAPAICRSSRAMSARGCSTARRSAMFRLPSAEQMAASMRHAHGGAGVLRLYGNYGGDVMNFDMAGEMLEMEDIASTTVLLADDVVSPPRCPNAASAAASRAWSTPSRSPERRPKKWLRSRK